MGAILIVALIVGVFFAVGLIVGVVGVIALSAFKDRPRASRGRDDAESAGEDHAARDADSSLSGHDASPASRCGPELGGWVTGPSVAAGVRPLDAGGRAGAAGEKEA